jgi:hypothetical protein
MGYGGDVLVLNVEDDVQVADGPGCVVMTTYSQADASVRELHFEGTAEPVHATAPHPFFSLDRHDWVAAKALAVGEKVRTRDGAASLTSNVPLPGTHTVYNFEVNTAHSYLISNAEIWVHNGPSSLIATIEANQRAVTTGFAKVANLESMGGNAGPMSMAVNGTADATTGEILEFGNLQNLSATTRAALSSGTAREFTIVQTLEKRTFRVAGYRLDDMRLAGFSESAMNALEGTVDWMNNALVGK